MSAGNPQNMALLLPYKGQSSGIANGALDGIGMPFGAPESGNRFSQTSSRHTAYWLDSHSGSNSGAERGEQGKERHRRNTMPFALELAATWVMFAPSVNEEIPDEPDWFEDG